MNILFIDDEWVRIEPKVEYLRKVGHLVKVTPTIHEAYEYFDAHKQDIDIIILDVMMPVTEKAREMNLINMQEAELGYSTGVMLYNRLKREIANDKPIAMVMLSARVDLDNFAFLKKDVADKKLTIIEKPIRLAALDQSLKEAYGNLPKATFLSK